jgi:hypothetical protein
MTAILKGATVNGVNVLIPSYGRRRHATEKWLATPKKAVRADRDPSPARLIAAAATKALNDSTPCAFAVGEVAMARIPGVEPQQASWLTRIVYWLVRRKVAKIAGLSRVVEPIKITAHHPRLLQATGRMEMGQDGARTVSDSLKCLASLRAATLIGCPF